MRRFLLKILISIKLFWYGLFYGMENANALIQGQSSEDSDNAGIHNVMKKGGAINDMLEQKVTKEVEELREKHYRILKEADKFDTSTIVMTFDADGNPVFKTDRLHKKTKADFMKHCPVLNDENLPIRTIQDNKKFEKKGSILNNDETTSDLSIPNGLYDYDTTLTINRMRTIPRIFIEKFATKMVVRETDRENRALVDIYLPSMASQFGKIDAILVSNLYTMFETKNLRSDLLDFEEIEWYSDKAWNSSDVCLFKYDDIKPVGINVFDGSFVITLDCNIVSNGEYLAEKYMTDEMQEKYDNLEAKKDLVLFEDTPALIRRDEKLEEKKKKKEINLETKTFKLDEDSD